MGDIWRGDHQSIIYRLQTLYKHHNKIVLHSTVRGIYGAICLSGVRISTDIYHI